MSKNRSCAFGSGRTRNPRSATSAPSSSSSGSRSSHFDAALVLALDLDPRLLADPLEGLVAHALEARAGGQLEDGELAALRDGLVLQRPALADR